MRRISYGQKIFFICLQIAALMIGTLIVYAFVSNREDNSERVCRDITEKWGDTFRLKGPVLKYSSDPEVLVDSTENVTPEAVPDREGVLNPRKYKCDVEVTTQTLHRGIYEVQVFTANVKVAGQFILTDLDNTEDVVICLKTDPKDVKQIEPLEVNGKKYEWEVDEDYYVKVPRAGLPEKISFSTSLVANGSEAVRIYQFPGSTITINGDAPSPKFTGNSLPSRRDVRSSGEFCAYWESNSNDESNSGYYVGTDFLVTMDIYRKVSRTLTYSFFIILLTYLAMLVTELLRKHRVPLMNYFLIGAALVIFYTLLLAFSELVGFGWSYLIASVMTAVLIGLYAWKNFNSKAMGLMMLIVLGVIYGGCYMMLVSSNYALLIGSLTLFCALALLMYVTVRPTPLQKLDEITNYNPSDFNYNPSDYDTTPEQMSNDPINNNGHE